MAEKVHENPSTRHCSQELNISDTSYHRIIQQDLRIMPYKVHILCIRLDSWAKEKLYEDVDYTKKNYFGIKIIFILYFIAIFIGSKIHTWFYEANACNAAYAV